ncbi:MAG TPA: sulfate adenylyltransferase, partial [Thermodesulfobacteriota bacterium]|nr:sulfate adenylyltransferase [Thermodesulfobacteriota bacterium]
IDLYLSKNGKRFRSIGCEPCCSPVESEAKTVDEIISELESSTTSERAGRAQDKENEYTMQKLRSLGYM